MKPVDPTAVTDIAVRADADWLQAHWMPYTGNREFKANPRLMVEADGAYYIDAEGRRIFDGLSGLWCTGLGHRRPELIEAVSRQMKTLDFMPPFQFGHPQSFALANRMQSFLPEGLGHVFFTGSGSEAADTSLKMARAYWRAKGKASKTRFIGREKGYHGVNFGGISVGGIVGNRKLFGQGVETDHLPHTQLPQNAFSRGMPQQGAELADDLQRLINLHDASNIAAVIVEPFSGSAGVVVPPVGYLQRLREICDQHDILLIFDEVITGFGRSGAWTGAAAFGVTPDILNCAKQITNGVQPLGAVIVKPDIYDTFMHADAPHYLVEFPHGYTYSAHPVACAAALATLDLLEREHAVERVNALAPYLEQKVHALRGCRHVTDIRNFGLAAGFTLAPAPGEPAKRPYEVGMMMWKQGFYVRYANDTVQLAPPFISTEAEIDRLVDALGQAFNALDP
ncbi:MAG: aspartate aminotransferase family protein [Betaproteobacteria bacterium]